MMRYLQVSSQAYCSSCVCLRGILSSTLHSRLRSISLSSFTEAGRSHLRQNTAENIVLRGSSASALPALSLGDSRTYTSFMLLPREWLRSQPPLVSPFIDPLSMHLQKINRSFAFNSFSVIAKAPFSSLRNANPLKSILFASSDLLSSAVWGASSSPLFSSTSAFSHPPASPPSPLSPSNHLFSTKSPYYTLLEDAKAANYITKRSLKTRFFCGGEVVPSKEGKQTDFVVSAAFKSPSLQFCMLKNALKQQKFGLNYQNNEFLTLSNNPYKIDFLRTSDAFGCFSPTGYSKNAFVQFSTSSEDSSAKQTNYFSNSMKTASSLPSPSVSSHFLHYRFFWRKLKSLSLPNSLKKRIKLISAFKPVGGPNFSRFYREVLLFRERSKVFTLQNVKERIVAYGGRRKHLKKLHKRIVENSKKAGHGFMYLWKKYGYAGIFTYVSVYLLTLSGLFVAVSYGNFQGEDLIRFAKHWRLDEHIDLSKAKHVDSGWGQLVVAWLACKLVEPLRAIVSIALTPSVASVLRRFNLFKR